MNCPKCGKENPEGARFCSNCGYDMDQDPQHLNPQYRGNRAEAGDDRRSSTTNGHADAENTASNRDPGETGEKFHSDRKDDRQGSKNGLLTAAIVGMIICTAIVVVIGIRLLTRDNTGTTSVASVSTASTDIISTAATSEISTEAVTEAATEAASVSTESIASAGTGRTVAADTTSPGSAMQIRPGNQKTNGNSEDSTDTTEAEQVSAATGYGSNSDSSQEIPEAYRSTMESAQSGSSKGYMLRDMNGDGTPELMIGSMSAGQISGEPIFQLDDVYTISGSKVQHLYGRGGSSRFYMYPMQDGSFVFCYFESDGSFDCLHTSIDLSAVGQFTYGSGYHRGSICGTADYTIDNVANQSCPSGIRELSEDAWSAGEISEMEENALTDGFISF